MSSRLPKAFRLRSHSVLDRNLREGDSHGYRRYIDVEHRSGASVDRHWLATPRYRWPTLPRADPSHPQAITVQYLAALLTEAQHAQELVVAPPLGGFSGMLLGLTSATVTQHSPYPVVVVHGQGDSTGPIVVGLDDSTASEQALRYAFEAASRTGAPVLAVHAWAGLGAAKSPLPPANELTFESIEAAERRMLAEQLGIWPEKYLDVPIERQVMRQRPAAALI